ncbi:MAG: VirC2 family conjugal transfer protein [Pseudomonadota bacterium]
MPAQKTNSKKPGRTKAKPQSTLQPETEKIPANGPSKTNIAINVPFPPAGLSVSFDHLCDTFPRNRALALILKKAMSAYEEHLTDGTFKSLPKDYQTGEGMFSTTRNIETDLYTIAKSHFDPYDLLPDRQLGGLIGTSALAAYFENEKQK